MSEATRTSPAPLSRLAGSNRNTSLYGTLWLVVVSLAVLATLLLPGCADASRAHAVNEPTARDALKTALDGWKNGKTPASFASDSSPMIVQDLEWSSGAKLLDYQLVDDGKAYDANLRIQVKLTLAVPTPRRHLRPKRRRKRSGTWSAQVPRLRSSVICSGSDIDGCTQSRECEAPAEPRKRLLRRVAFCPETSQSRLTQFAFFTEYSNMVINSPWKRASHLLAAGVTLAILVAADEPGKPPRQPSQAPGGEAAEVAEALKESWPDHPEWVDMLTAILQDEPMSATYGWFRTAVAQTRFDWAATRKRYDRDGDGKVARGRVSRRRRRFLRGSTAIATKH